MRAFVLVMVASMVAGSALAQQSSAPQVEVFRPRDSINLAVGQATRLNFPDSFDRIDVTSDTIVQVKPVTDRAVTLQGLTQGEAILTIFGGTRELWSGIISIGTERGHTVKFYDGKSKDYTGYYCTDIGCGRADKELNGAREVGSVTTVIGGVARTVTYGGSGQR